MENAVINQGYVRTKDALIEEIGEMNAFSRLETDDLILDVNGAWVLPGLIEAHCHIGITEEKWGAIADDSNECTIPVTPVLRAIDAVNPMETFTQTFYTIINGEIVYDNFPQ